MLRVMVQTKSLISTLALPSRPGFNRALLVSPQHCLLMALPDGSAVFCRARHLAEETRLASFAKGREAIRYYLLLPEHGALISEGWCSEGFYPGAQAMALMNAVERCRAVAAAPRLKDRKPLAGCGPRARRILTREDVQRTFGNGALAFTNADQPERISPDEISIIPSAVSNQRFAEACESISF
ncbi:MAG: hypothetical protein HKP51_08050 [Sulfitobacter sp.]|nr:hypothetical protein [Sulfitobacter sp.]